MMVQLSSEKSKADEFLKTGRVGFTIQDLRSLVDIRHLRSVHCLHVGLGFLCLNPLQGPLAPSLVALWCAESRENSLSPWSELGGWEHWAEPTPSVHAVPTLQEAGAKCLRGFVS